MSDDRVRTLTRARAAASEVAFQEYFVRLRHEVEVRGGALRSAPRTAAPAPGVLAALARGRGRPHRPLEPARVDRADPRGAGRRRGARAPPATSVVAISPIVGGRRAQGAGRRGCSSSSAAKPPRSASRRPLRGRRARSSSTSVDADSPARSRPAGMRAVVTDTVMRDDRRWRRALTEVAAARPGAARCRASRRRWPPGGASRRQRSRRARSPRHVGQPLDGDVVVVTQKIVSKAEGRIVAVDGDDEAAKRRLVESRGGAGAAPSRRPRDHRDPPRLCLRELRRRPLERRGGLRRPPADRPRPFGAADPRRPRTPRERCRSPWSSPTPSGGPGGAASPTSRSAVAGIAAVLDLRGERDAFGRRARCRPRSASPTRSPGPPSS